MTPVDGQYSGAVSWKEHRVVVVTRELEVHGEESPLRIKKGAEVCAAIIEAALDDSVSNSFDEAAQSRGLVCDNCVKMKLVKALWVKTRVIDAGWSPKSTPNFTTLRSNTIRREPRMVFCEYPAVNCWKITPVHSTSLD